MSLIEKFFSYELNDTELDRFDQLYKNDPSFQRKVERYRIAKGYVEEKFFPEQETLLQEKRKELEKLNPQENTAPRPILQRIIMAASVVLLLGLAFWLFNKPQETGLAVEQQALAIAENTTNLDLLELSVRSGQITKKNQLLEAVQTQNWAEVISLTDSLPSDDPALAIAAIAHYHRGAYQRALQLFQQSKKQNTGIEDNILWWQVTTHLQLQQKDQAKAMLEEIIKKKFPSAEQAKTLLQQIEQAE